MLSHVMSPTFDQVEEPVEKSDGASRADNLSPDLSLRRAALQSAYDDPAAHVYDVHQALLDVMFAKLESRPSMPWTREEHICYDAFMLDVEAYNGGFAQWIHNHFSARMSMTRMALQCIGAGWAAELLDEFVRALPIRIRSVLAKNDIQKLNGYRLSHRRERLLDAIDDRYFAENSVRGDDASVAGLTLAYARRHRVGLA